MKKVFKVLTVLFLVATFAISVWSLALYSKFKNNNEEKQNANIIKLVELSKENEQILTQRDTLSFVVFATSAAGIVCATIGLFVPESKKRKRSVK